MKVLESTDITSFEALRILEKESYAEVQKRTRDFLRKYLPLKDDETLKKIKKELENLRELKEHQINKLLEIFPTHKDIVEAIFYKERLIISKEEIEKIANLFKSLK
jgi:DNA-directed RNA polymerase subunit F